MYDANDNVTAEITPAYGSGPVTNETPLGREPASRSRRPSAFRFSGRLRLARWRHPLFALGTDYVSSERAEQVAIAKSCADARKAGATTATLPAVCGVDPREGGREHLGAARAAASCGGACGTASEVPQAG